MSHSGLQHLADMAAIESKSNQPMETSSNLSRCIIAGCTQPVHGAHTSVCLSHYLQSGLRACSTQGCKSNAMLYQLHCSPCNERYKMCSVGRQPEKPLQPVYGVTTLAGLPSSAEMPPRYNRSGNEIHFWPPASQSAAQQYIHSATPAGIPGSLQMDAKHLANLTANINQRFVLQSWAVSQALMPGVPDDLRQMVRDSLQKISDAYQWCIHNIVMGPNVFPHVQPQQQQPSSNNNNSSPSNGKQPA